MFHVFMKENLFIYTKADGLAVDQANIGYADSRGAVWIGWHTLLARYQKRQNHKHDPAGVISWHCMKIAKEICGPGPARDCHNLLTENSCPVLRGAVFRSVRAGHRRRQKMAVCGWARGAEVSFTGMVTHPFSTQRHRVWPARWCWRFIWTGRGRSGSAPMAEDCRVFRMAGSKISAPLMVCVMELIPVILEDDAGNLWINAEKEILRVSKKELNDVRLEEFVPCPRSAMTPPTEMKGTIYLMGIQPQGWKAEDGSLWFANR